ncbi:MAG TPA: 3'-5' exonuclease [Gemmatimonadaceae bacterium]|nr:3'-5' exonuclease [Gemmatimonadaceae bacterium]
MGLTVGVREIETTLVRRALSFLAAGPSDPVPLIEHVCQLPGAPRVVAEQMAIALFANRPEFARDASGRWSLAPDPTIQSRDRATDRDAFRDELEALSYVVVDVETTGMNALLGDRVTEIAAVVVRGGRIAEQFQTLVNPERPIPSMITALTHITPQMVRHAPRFREIAPDLLQFLQGHVFVAHNAEFDWRFVSAEVARATNRQLTGRRLCTVRLARRVLPQLRSRKLDSLAQFYNVTITDRHRAAGDALATAHILLRLLDAARERDCRGWTDLEGLLGARSRGRRRRRGEAAMPRAANDDTTA